MKFKKVYETKNQRFYGMPILIKYGNWVKSILLKKLKRRGEHTYLIKGGDPDTIRTDEVYLKRLMQLNKGRK